LVLINVQRDYVYSADGNEVESWWKDTDTEKLLYPHENVSKRDLVDYKSRADFSGFEPSLPR
jgi:hypothetical protein